MPSTLASIAVLALALAVSAGPATDPQEPGVDNTPSTYGVPCQHGDLYPDKRLPWIRLDQQC